jgi:glucose-6-phosphate 1-dehydrogenase
MNYSNPLRFGLESEKEAEPFVIFIFGVTGDLTARKLMPALFSLFLKGMTRFKVVGFARRDWGTEGLRERARGMIAEVPGSTEEQREAFVERLHYLQSTFEDESGYARMDPYAEGYPNRIYYLSTPPAAYPDIIGQLGRQGLGEQRGGFTRILIEKPFGRDFASAEELNELLARYFTEEQIFRIDHYLGKETVQNIMLLRFGNGIFEPIWNSNYIDHIQITVAEKIGVGTRGGYFESAGTLRDMVQNHMFQLLSLTTMEPPNDLSPDSIRNEKVKAMQAVRPVTFRDMDEHVVRAQYDRGIVDGRHVPAYRDEERVSPDSRTETYVALKLFLDTWRWSGVPVFLRSGKRLLRKVSEISIHFKEPPRRLFTNRHPSMSRNTLIIRIQPEEGITLNMNAKIPGHTTDMRPVNMDFAYGSTFGEATLEAYERLLFDAILGDATLYPRRDEIETSWAFITRILEAWERDRSPIPTYMPGSSGPEEARRLIASCDRKWRKL